MERRVAIKAFNEVAQIFSYICFLAAKYETILRTKQSQTLYENLRNKRRLSPYDDAYIYLIYRFSQS